MPFRGLPAGRFCSGWRGAAVNWSAVSELSAEGSRAESNELRVANWEPGVALRSRRVACPSVGKAVEGRSSVAKALEDLTGWGEGWGTGA